MDTTTPTHFTAWLVNDKSCLDQPFMDVSIIPDVAITASGPNGEIQEGDWSCDAGKPAEFYAVTNVDAENGDVDDATTEAEILMRDAGWNIVGQWDATPNAYTVTVERSA